jgi:thiamine-phosphate diphosphorylase
LTGRPTALAARLRVYVITSGNGRYGHADLAAAAIAGGATAVQLRAPELDDAALLPLARHIATACHQAGVLFVVNDRVEVAAATGADGVHLGQGDDYPAARRVLGADQVLGVSARGVDDVDAAVAAGADYLGVTVWPTATKPDAQPAGLETLRAVAAASPLPVVGVGGITVARAGAVLAAGAAGVAVVAAVAGAPDPVAATRALVQAVDALTTGRRTSDG